MRGGTRELVQVVAVSLAWRGLLKIGKSDLRAVRNSEAERVSPPIEKVVLQACSSAAKPTSVVTDAAVAKVADTYEWDLQLLQLLANDEVRRARWRPVLLVIALLCGLAGIKALVAMSTGHRNVEGLLVLSFFAALFIYRRVGVRRTGSGDAALRDLATLFSGLKRRKRSANNAATDATMLAAVFGIYQAPGVTRSMWAKLFAPPKGSGSSTSCGSSCGGGSGCGGGGCGGCGS